MLRIEGHKFIDESGKEIILRGQNLGNWLLIEPNMFGTPGTEHRLRRAMELYAGKDKSDAFWNSFYRKWITEKDIKFLASIGCNSVRIPFNYRHFESDAEPFVYKEEGFHLLHRVVMWCKKYEIRPILDLHAAQGFQSGDWHCDNLFSEQVNLYHDRQYQERYIALWKEIARRYCDEDIIAGYDLLNEPVCADATEMRALNDLYRETVAAIREVDPHHIIFLEGNQWSTDFSQMDAPFDDKLAYSPHYYNPAATRRGTWPMEVDGVMQNRDRMEADISERDGFMKRYNVPLWIGEFGVRRYPDIEIKDDILREYLRCFEARGHSWCYWNFKDFGLRGPLYLKPDNAWYAFTQDIRALKIKYHADRAHTDDAPWTYEQFLGRYQAGEFELSQKELANLLDRNVRETLGDQLTLTFGKKFASLTFEDIERLTDSFLFENCEAYRPWANIFANAAKGLL